MAEVDLAVASDDQLNTASNGEYWRVSKLNRNTSWSPIFEQSTIFHI